uniref:Uncharacterized protein n=1 Tax=Physcomitrium patens TaxID=3218 RepID=A0A2K1IZ70_PHYPA|nr:hypothetical protein PHYPA_024390 [Physcomitrium patens]
MLQLILIIACNPRFLIASISVPSSSLSLCRISPWLGYLHPLLTLKQAPWFLMEDCGSSVSVTPLSTSWYSFHLCSGRKLCRRLRCPRAGGMRAAEMVLKWS